MANSKIYKFECGHVGISTVVLSKNICPKCGSGILGGLYTCEDCGAEFVSKRNGNGVFRCKDCYAIYDKARRKVYGTAYQKKLKEAKTVRKAVRKAVHVRVSQEKPLEPSMRPSCKFFNHCMNFALQEDINACQGCKLYVSKSTPAIRGCGANHRVHLRE